MFSVVKKTQHSVKLLRFVEDYLPLSDNARQLRLCRACFCRVFLEVRFGGSCWSIGQGKVTISGYLSVWEEKISAKSLPEWKFRYCQTLQDFMWKLSTTALFFPFANDLELFAGSHFDRDTEFNDFRWHTPPPPNLLVLHGSSTLLL